MKKKKLPERIKPQGTLDEFLTKLKALGYRFLDGGLFSDAYVKDDVVVKVARNDPGYDTFLEYALAYQDNPYFPTIFKVDVYKEVETYFANSENVTVVTMERLKSVENTKVGFRVSDKVEDDALGLSKIPYRKNPDYIEAMKVLRALKKQVKRIDLHSGNIMYRGKQLVITDPVV